MPGLIRMHWSRKEIENYLLHEAFLLRFLEEHHGPESGEKARVHIEDSWPPVLRRKPFLADSVWVDIPGKKVLKDVLKAADADPNRDLGILAEAMTPDEIHPEVKGRLDRIAEHLNL